MISAPVHPPAIISPGPNQVSFGAIWGTVGHSVERVVVRIDGHKRAARPPRGHHFAFSLSLPRRDFTRRVTAVSRHGAASTVVHHVFGLPRRASPRRVAGYREPRVARPVRRLVRGFPGTAAAYVEDLVTGAGAAWNAGARFPAASTLKLAIAVELLRSLRGPPPSPRSYLGSLMTAMLDYSDNVAANQLLTAAGGSWRVNTTLRLLGLRDTTARTAFRHLYRGRRALSPLRARPRGRSGEARALRARRRNRGSAQSRVDYSCAPRQRPRVLAGRCLRREGDDLQRLRRGRRVRRACRAHCAPVAARFRAPAPVTSYDAPADTNRGGLRRPGVVARVGLEI